MAKTRYISLILLLILVVTLVNLFYKPWIYDTQSTVSQFFQRQFASPLTQPSCAMHGLKCDDDKPCDCEKLCGSKEFFPFRVLANESFYLMNHQLAPGTYCLPKGIGNCNLNTSYHVFSLAGWKCINRNTSVYQDEAMIACKAAGAQNNDLNFLWDAKLGMEAKDVENPYELLPDGKTMRYQCVCSSKDMRNISMVSVLPFTCSVDYCTANIFKPLPMMKFRDNQCECMVYPHQDPNDDASPCVMERERVDGNKMTGVVECMTNNAWKKRAIFCPSQDKTLTFETLVMGGKNNYDFVKAINEHYDNNKNYKP